MKSSFLEIVPLNPARRRAARFEAPLTATVGQVLGVVRFDATISGCCTLSWNNTRVSEGVRVGPWVISFSIPFFFHVPCPTKSGHDSRPLLIQPHFNEYKIHDILKLGLELVNLFVGVMDEVAGVLSMHLALLVVVIAVDSAVLTVQLIDQEK